MSVLVDTSVWVQHFNTPENEMLRLLNAGQVVSHGIVVGELAVGGLCDRAKTLADLHALTRHADESWADALDFVEANNLFGIGLGWNDAQILAAAVRDNIPIWTFDKRLQVQARRFGVEWVSPAPSSVTP